MPNFLKSAFIRTATKQRNGAWSMAGKSSQVDIQPSAELLPLVGFVARDESCQDWSPIDRIALWIDTLTRAGDSNEVAAPVIEFEIYARTDTCHERLLTATWSPTSFEESGLLVQVTNRLCTCFEVYARVVPSSTAASVNIMLRAVFDRAGPPYDTWHGANVVLS